MKPMPGKCLTGNTLTLAQSHSRGVEKLSRRHQSGGRKNLRDTSYSLHYTQYANLGDLLPKENPKIFSIFRFTGPP